MAEAAHPTRPAALSSLWLGLSLLVACASRAPVVAVDGAPASLEALLARHPLGADQQVRADLLARSAGASYHLVQVRGREEPHRHASHDLVVLVLRGAGTLTLAEARMKLAAGDVALVRRAAAHWFANDGPEPAVALIIFTPPLDAPDTVPVDSSADGG